MIRNSKPKFRVLAGAIGATALIGFTAGCTATESDTTGSGEEQTTITVVGYSGIFQDAYTAAVIEPFEAANPDITVEFDGKPGGAEQLAGLRGEAGDPVSDVVIMDTSVSQTASEEGLLSELSEDDVPNLANVVERGQNTDGYGPAVTFDTLALFYNPSAYDTVPEGWDSLYDAEPSSLAIASPPGILGLGLMFVTAEGLGDDYETDIQPAVDKLATLGPLVQTWDPQPDMYQLVQNGTADMAIGWNARSQYYETQDDSTLVVAETESTIEQINTINMVEGSDSPEAALAFIDYALSTEAQAALATEIYYSPTVEGVTLDEDVTSRLATSESTELIPVDWSWVAANRTALADTWRSQIIGG